MAFKRSPVRSRLAPLSKKRQTAADEAAVVLLGHKFRLIEAEKLRQRMDLLVPDGVWVPVVGFRSSFPIRVPILRDGTHKVGGIGHTFLAALAAAAKVPVKGAINYQLGGLEYGFEGPTLTVGPGGTPAYQT